MSAATTPQDPATVFARLSSQQKRGLKLIALYRLYRRRNGFGQAPASVSLEIVRSLRALELVQVETNAGPAPCPVLTTKGQTIHAVIEQRSSRRSA